MYIGIGSFAQWNRLLCSAVFFTVSQGDHESLGWGKWGIHPCCFAAFLPRCSTTDKAAPETL